MTYCEQFGSTMEFIWHLYDNEGLSPLEIAYECQCSTQWVRTVLSGKYKQSSKPSSDKCREVIELLKTKPMYRYTRIAGIVGLSRERVRQIAKHFIHETGKERSVRLFQAKTAQCRALRDYERAFFIEAKIRGLNPKISVSLDVYRNCHFGGIRVGRYLCSVKNAFGPDQRGGTRIQWRHADSFDFHISYLPDCRWMIIPKSFLMHYSYGKRNTTLRFNGRWTKKHRRDPKNMARIIGDYPSLHSCIGRWDYLEPKNLLTNGIQVAHC